MKILNILLAIVFAAFAALQYNDPDPLQWIAVYGAVAVLSALASFGRYPRWAIIGLAIVIAGWMLWLSPAVIEWMKLGFPTITGAMEPDEPYVELVRECLGLLIALLAVLHLWRSSHRKI